MTESDRRRFLKQSAALVSGLALEGCGTGGEPPGTLAGASATLDAVGNVVLPRTALGDAGIARVLEGFRDWLEGFEPGAELDHPYIWTDEIRYAPPDPEPLWAAQLQALELEAERRHGASFPELEREEQETLLREQLSESEEADLPEPERASHVALGLLGYFYQTSEANDLCYEASIERHTCRGLDTATDAPARS